MSTTGADRSEEPQKERGAVGSRDTGSAGASGGPADRPSGSLHGDDSVPTYGEGGDSGADMTGTLPPQDAEPAVPPYEGRRTSAAPTGADAGSARTGGATGPQSDSGYKAPAPGATPGGRTASPADEQPASRMPETDRDDDMTGPAHAAGTGRGEDKR